uniref:Uncharacterized protein n=1 Tax=Anguilla anguilla TaxID=7936 RepID=A0A0E9T4V6_ANGAN
MPLKALEILSLTHCSAKFSTHFNGCVLT